MVKKILLLLSVSLLALNYYNVPNAHSNAAAPPKGRTNAPGETTCAVTGCHVGTLNSGTGSIQVAFNNGQEAYSPGQTYNMSVTVSSTGATRWGFEVVALNTSNASVGTFVVSDAINTAIGSANSRQYIYHKNAPTGANSHTFNFQWTAPTTNQGNVTFYAIGNAANNQNNAAGDLIYTTTKMVSFNTAITKVPAGSNLLNAYPNPATETLYVDYAVQTADFISLSITDLSGKTIAVPVSNAYKNAGQYTETLPIDMLSTGIYFLQISNTAGNTYLQKIVVTK